ncbi:MAG TPA: YncE family protein [Terriglobales bacterium]|nr:YncE family protein [Terriglobales bacterium]
MIAARFFIFFGLAIAHVSAQSQAAATGPFLLILNKSDNEVAFVDPASLKVVARVPTGEGPHEAVVSSDGKTAYVANYGAQTPGSSLSIIDVPTKKEVKRVDLGALRRPHGIIEVNGNIYFSVEGNRAVARYNPKSDKVDWVMGTGQVLTHMVVASKDGNKLFTANIAADTITSIQMQGATGPQGMQHLKIGSGPEGIDISPSGSELWVATRNDGNVHIVDPASFTVKESFAAGKFPIRVKFTPDGKRALVSNAQGGDVVVFDATTRKEIKRIMVGESPVGILVQPDGKRACVAAMQSGKVVVIDLEKLEVVTSIQPGNAPDGMAWVK